MEGLGGLGAGSVPIYRRPAKPSKIQKKLVEVAKKQRSKSKARLASPVAKRPSTSSENTVAAHTPTSDGTRSEPGPRPDTATDPQKDALAEFWFPSATGSTVSLPPAPLPQPPPPPSNSPQPDYVPRRDHSASPWNEAKKARSTKPKGGAGAQIYGEVSSPGNGAGETTGAATFRTGRNEILSQPLPLRRASLIAPLIAAGTATGSHRPLTHQHDPIRPLTQSVVVQPAHALAASAPLWPPAAGSRPQRPRIVVPQSTPQLQPLPVSQFSSPVRAPTPKQRVMAGGSAYTSTSGVGTATVSPAATFQHIQDMSAKRISTLDYLRKTHEGPVYWFNTLRYSRPDLLRLPSFQPTRLGRRASHLLMLGMSLPVALDGVSMSPLEYLRALNALLSEFEQFQTIHPVEGGTNASGSFSRTKFPQMFKRSHTPSVKNRRASTAADIGLPLAAVDSSSFDGSSGFDPMTSSTGSLAGSAFPNTPGPGAPPPTANSTASASSTSTMALPPPDTATLLPGEEYMYLLTPSLPFDPDFFEVFATLCDMLIDVYVRISTLVNTPEKLAIQPALGDVFNKADARIRKVLVQGMIKEFEEATRGGVKTEVASVGKVVLGNLM